MKIIPESQDYQEISKEFSKVHDNRAFELTYYALGLCGEAGEVAEKVKKLIRDKNLDITNTISSDDLNLIVLELGDVLWYLTQISTYLGVDLSTVASKNIEKLQSRKERGVIGGSGDNR